MRRAIAGGIFVLLCGILVFGLQGAKASAGEKEIILATTTSTQDTGLLDELLPVFGKKTGYFVKTIAVGSGQAMAMGERGEADVLLVHSPEAERRFMKAGFGSARRIVMHNDFVLIGPRDDPAKIRGLKSSVQAFKKIASAKSLFISRADKSGTHVKEQTIWRDAGIDPESQRWYQQTGLGMGQTLAVADEKGGYTLTDRATYLSFKKKTSLEILVEKEAQLKNIYHVIEVNKKKWPRVNAGGARAFADFMVSREAQKIIKDFGVQKYGRPLYFPDALR